MSSITRVILVSALALSSWLPASVLGASDPNLIAAASVPSTDGSFQYQVGVTTTGNPAQIYSLVLNTLSNAPAIEYTDVHYVLNDNVAHQTNQRLVNDTTAHFTSKGIFLNTNDVLKFNYTYLSYSTGTAASTYAYSFSPASNQVQLITNIIVPQAGTTVKTPDFQYTGFNWYTQVQKYTNIDTLYTVELIADNAAGIDWCNVHYIDSGVGSLQNQRMNRNDSSAALGLPANSVMFSYDIDLKSKSDVLKWNFTLYNLQDDAAEDTQAFLWTPSSSIINYIDNINNANAQANTGGQAGYIGGGATYGSATGANGGSPSGSTTQLPKDPNSATAASSLHAVSATLFAALCAYVMVL